MKTIEVDTKVKVQYVIPLWQRDLQIKHAIATVKGRIQPHEGTRSGPCAIVCYGPSLRDTWEKIRDFKFVWSCSGAHKFLIERGIIPNWHMAVDPLKKNTVELIGQPHKDVEYLIASTCAQDVFDLLEGYNVKLWHVFDSEEEGRRTLPPGEWAICGGCDIGLRTLTMARFYGFTDLHVFGMDGSSPDEKRHADVHPTKVTACERTEYPKDSGVFYNTTTGMLAAAQMVPHELDQMPDVKVKFYGNGLIQAMMADYSRKKEKVSVIAFRKPELISAEYRRLNAQLHKENMAYGVGAQRHVDTVKKLIDTGKYKSVLDYGCGKGLLAKGLDVPIWEYDPAFPDKAEDPKPADLVCCLDVLEHIERDKLDVVLADLSRCVKQVGYFTIHTGPALKFLPDGRNTHLIQESRDWWEGKLSKYFLVAQIILKGKELHAVVGVKNGARMAPRMSAKRVDEHVT